MWWAILAVAALAFTAAATGCATGFDRGQAALEAGDDERAESIAREALETDADTPWANLLVAEILVDRAEYADAHPYAQAADESEAFPVRAARLVGDIHRRLDEPVDAAEAYRRARRADPQSVDDELFAEVLADALAYAGARGEHETRWRLANWLAELDPEHPEVAPERLAVIRRSLAVQLRRGGDYVEAVELLEQALEDDPENLRGEALDLGKIYARMEMKRRAVDAWDHYLGEEVDEQERIQRHLDVASAAARHGMAQTAADTLEGVPDQIEDRYRRGDVMLQLARYQVRSDSRSRARRTVYDYLELMTGEADDGRANPTPYRRAAELAEQLGYTRLTINVLERGIEQAEPSRTLTRKLVDIYARRAQLDAAEETLELFVDRHDDTVEANTFAGEWARERDNFELARTFLQRAAEHPDAPPEHWRDLADVHGQLDDDERLDSSLDTYLQRRDEDDTAIAEAAELLVEHNQFDRAEQLLERLQRRAPTRRSAARQFAELYFEQARPDLAAQVWEQWIDARGDDPGDIVSVARLLKREDVLERSAQLFERAAQMGNTDAWLEAADVHLRRDDERGVAESLQAYVDAGDDRTEVLREAAQRYGRADMHSHQMRTLEQLVDYNPGDWRAYRRLAVLLLQRGHHAEASDHLSRFVEHSDDPADALRRIGEQLHDPDWAGALLQFYRRWYDTSDARPVVVRLVGDAYWALARRDELNESAARRARQRARDHYLEYVDIAGDEHEDWAQLGEQWRRRQMWRPALTAFERAADHADGREHPQPVGYAETLLQLSDTDRAVELLEDGHRRARPDAELSGRIAQLLVEFSLFDEAEPFASRLMLSGNTTASRRGFRLMAEIHEQREDYDALDRLTAEFLDRTGDTNRARRTVIRVLDDTGQWESAAERFDEFELTGLHQFDVQAAAHWFRAGDFQRAWHSFERAAERSEQPENAWRDAGNFLAGRGDYHAAEEAFALAVDANPDDLDVRTARGSFAIRNGDVTTGWDDYRFARRFGDDFSASRRGEFFEAFAEIGHFQSARTVARHFEDDGKTPPNEVRLALGQWGLHEESAADRRRAVERLQAASWGIFEAVDHIEPSGRYDELLELVRGEFEQGDATTAGALLLNYAVALSRLVGWPRQREWLREVVDPLQFGDGRLVGPVGDHRARVGAFDDARLYLGAATDRGDDHFLGQYGHTLLALGEYNAAFAVFESSLRRSPTPSRTLTAILLRFELAGEHQRAHRFLDHLTGRAEFLDIALPLRTHYAVEQHGDPARAVDQAVEIVESHREQRSVDSPAYRGGGASSALDRRIQLQQALFDSLAAVASLGHLGEVERRLDADLPVDNDRRARQLRLKIQLARGDFAAAAAQGDELVDSADDHARRQNTRLQLAEQFLAAGADAPARAVIEEALRQQTRFDDHRPFELKLQLLTVTGEDDLTDFVDDYLERVPNRHGARLAAIEELKRLGRDGEALRLAREAVATRPTDRMYSYQATAAFGAGNTDALADALDGLFDIADDPVDRIEQTLLGRFPGAEAELVLTVVERVRRARPHRLDWLLEHVRALFEGGDTAGARALLEHALQARNYHRQAVTEAVDVLGEHNLDVEIADIVAPQIPDDQWSPNLLVAAAEANLALNRRDEANRWLDRLDETSDRPAMWRIELADRLVRRELFDRLGEALPEDSGEDTGPYLDVLRGLRALSDGDPETGLILIRTANAEGVDRFRTHHAGIRAALASDQPAAARELFDELIELPVRDDDALSLPVRVLLSAAGTTEEGAQLARSFLERNRPRLADGRGVNWRELTGQLAGVFENTGDPEGARGVYRDRLWQAQFLDDNAPITTYLNNLAFTRATTGGDPEAGLDEIRRAIALDDDRRASFIDTLGWVLYRQGDLEAAEREIRRALRSYEGPPGGLSELLRHLQIISEQRGNHDTAAHLEAHRNRLPPEGLEW